MLHEELTCSKLTESASTKLYTEADFTWDAKTIVADFKQAVVAYANGANLEDALRDVKIMIISGVSTVADPLNTKGLFYSECAKYGIGGTTRVMGAADSAVAEPMYIIAPNGGAGGNIYYMGRNLAVAQKQYKKDARDFVKYGVGGGDTAIELYEYKGDPKLFETVYAVWTADGDTDFNTDIEELGFSLADCITLESVEG
jgi:hypothetical protein